MRAIARVGPSELTLAEVAREIGLAPATLLQRFGSKRDLLLAVAKASSGGVNECFAQVRAANPSPLAAIFASFDEMTRFCNTPQSMAHSLAFSQIDLMDPPDRTRERSCDTGGLSSPSGRRHRSA
jgi:AcrR family transcriptional regulator